MLVRAEKIRKKDGKDSPRTRGRDFARRRGPRAPTRRRYTAEYRQSILKAADALCEPGQIGALLRREGIYSSLLSKWRAQRDRGARDALRPRKRGRKPALHAPEQARIVELELENRTLRAKLQQAKLIIDVQKSCQSARRSPPDDNSERDS